MSAALPDELEVAILVGASLDRLAVPYFLGGSLASSIQGEPRATNDIDIVAALPERSVPAFAAALGPDFEIDQLALQEACRNRSSWNVFHLPTALKIDLFIAGLEPFDRAELDGRHRIELAPGRSLQVKRPEDTVLRKLLWFRSGGSVSDRQWRDLVSVLRSQRPRLDTNHLERWSKALGLEALLARAFVDAER